MTVKFFEGGRVLRNVGDVAVTVTENGADQNATLSCSSDPLTLALVLDRSNSMSCYPNTSIPDPNLTRWKGAKTALHTFIDQLTALDECALISFATNVTIDMGLTDIQDSLHAALERLSYSLTHGTTAWDATQQAVSLVSARPGAKAVILLTDGEDRSSSMTPAAVTANAAAQGIRIFTVGLGDEVSRSTLGAMATGTGGAYYFTADPDSLTAVYRDITQQLVSACTVTYRSTNPCNDGIRRDVRLLSSRGSDTAVFDTLYFAPDRTPSVELRLASFSVAASGSRLTVPCAISSGWRADEPLHLQAMLRYPADLLSSPAVHLRFPLPENGAQLAVTAPGVALITIAVDSLPLRDSILLDLEFTATDLAHPQSLTFGISEISAVQSCLLLVSGSSSSVIIDGRCAALIVRSPGMLLAPFPNPSPGNVVIPFSLPAASGAGDHDAVLRVIDAFGQTVATLLDGAVQGGEQRVVWNARGAASGTYTVELIADGERDVKRIVIAR